MLCYYPLIEAAMEPPIKYGYKKMADLMRYEDASYIREATKDEIEESREAAKRDGGAGAIVVEVDGEDVTCYVSE